MLIATFFLDISSVKCLYHKWHLLTNNKFHKFRREREKKTRRKGIEINIIASSSLGIKKNNGCHGYTYSFFNEFEQLSASKSYLCPRYIPQEIEV